VLVNGLCVYWVNWFLFSELSGAFSNVRRVLILLDRGAGGLYNACLAVWLSLWLFTRLVPLPSMIAA
jgi:hypothetical protein